MEVHQLRYFLAVAEEANFSRAAERLRVAQPSLSQQIKKLEDDCGQALFDRLPRRVVLTQAGHRLLPFARRVLADLANARASLAEPSGDTTGHVVLGVIPTIAPFILPGLLQDLRKAHPKLTIKVVESVTDDLVRGLDDGELDLAVVSTCRPAQAFTLQSLTVEPLMLVVPPSHRLAGARNVSARQMQQEKILVLRQSHCLATQVARFCRHHQLRPEVSLEGTQLFTLFAMIAAGYGIALAPRMSLKAAEAAGCRHVPFRGRPPTREINLLTNPHRFQDHATRAVRDRLPFHFEPQQ